MIMNKSFWMNNLMKLIMKTLTVMNKLKIEEK